MIPGDNDYTPYTKRRERMNALKLGEGCTRCGYDRCARALHYHHRDPATKLFSVGGSGLNKSWLRIMAEIEKCELLCANCHAEQHD